jgi:predicted metal-dependent enzyme (double-stranded beta helix superfamily)
LADSTFARRCHLPLEGMFAMFDKDRFIEDCRAAAKETQPGLAVKELIARAVSDPREVARAFGEPQAGLVDVLYRGDDINILHVAWAPLMTLLPHDHLMWVAIGIYGGREETSTFELAQGIVAALERHFDEVSANLAGRLPEDPADDVGAAEP